ncbi:MAG: glutamate racemase [Deltaproteobacteria bacterium]|nr:glutamate racemase [Deltaproteobacteria bacterium]
MDANDVRPVGVFDSGVGGLSVLRCMREELPNEDFLYVADSGYAPYGDKLAEYIEKRAFTITQFLIKEGAKAIVVACNTATAVAIAKLRSAFDIPIIGMEPGVKPAIAATQCKVVGIMATTETLKSEKFRLLVNRFCNDCTIVTQACPGLVEQVERFDLEGKKTCELLKRYVGELLEKGVDIIVLGCTHYPFLSGIIQKIAGNGVKVIDTGVAVAREVRRRLEAAGILDDRLKVGMERFWTSGDLNNVQIIIRQLWKGDAIVRPLPQGQMIVN